ncbi:MAG: TIGR00730 family Rossman fold protein [Prevotella sp.]|nr:TIGR00730 family Rossman fold protein [Prevotella sp.]
MKIGVFCSANDYIADEYFETTKNFARWCAKNGHSIVYGGCDKGLMGCVARAYAETCEKPKNGELIGVVPRIIERGNMKSDELTTLISCENLSDRKDLLLAHSDVLVALPGGIGTLDEVFTVAASHTIGYHHKTVILYNVNGFWNALIGLMDDLQRRGMIRGHWTDYIRVAASPDELAAMLNSCVAA